MRRVCLSLALLTAAVVAVAPAQASVAKHCAGLRGTKVLATDAIRVVGVAHDEINRSGGTHIVGRDFYACALPNGTVRKVGFIYREYATTGSVKGMDAVDSGLTSFGSSAGTFLVTRTREADLTGDYAEQTYRVVDVATGNKYAYYHHLVSEDDEAKLAAPSRTILDDTGRLATVVGQKQDDGFEVPAVGRVQVAVYSATGRRKVLDDAPFAAIPPASLSFAGGVVGWTDAGAAKTANAT